jgi:hypothetical protein
VQRKQGWEKTLRQIQGDHLIEKKKRKGENPKANLRRQHYTKNNNGRKP